VVTESDRIRAEIEATRGDLADNVSTLADRTNPKRIASRRWDSMKYRARSLRHRIMGATIDARDSVSDTASDVADTVREAPDMVARQTQGSPIAAGLIAFGVGMLTAAMVPVSEAERRAAGQLAEKSGELLEPVRETARQFGEDVKESASTAVQEVAGTAKEAASRTADQARESGAQVTEQVRRS
jgi:ElaB/YqjD/DUF883 family membrane-anchored ribosome-binding protein